jgi:hypothetical protein
MMGVFPPQTCTAVPITALNSAGVSEKNSPAPPAMNSADEG